MRYPLDPAPSRYANGWLLKPADVTALVTALHAQYPLDATTVRWQLQALLAPYVIGGSDWRVLYDNQIVVLHATLTALARLDGRPAPSLAPVLRLRNRRRVSSC